MIRKMLQSDLDEVLKIEKESFYDSWNYDQFMYELNENPYSELYVITCADKIIGYYDLWIIFEHAEIATIAVSEMYRGKHYGKLMMDDIEKRAIDNSCETISLEVRVSNKRAIGLYEKCGFTLVNTKPGYYKTASGFEDGYFMMKGI